MQLRYGCSCLRQWEFQSNTNITSQRFITCVSMKGLVRRVILITPIVGPVNLNGWIQRKKVCKALHDTHCENLTNDPQKIINVLDDLIHFFLLFISCIVRVFLFAFFLYLFIFIVEIAVIE